MSNKATIEREFGAFSPISDSSPKYVLSLDKIAFGRRIRKKVKGTKEQYQRVSTNEYILSEGKHAAIIDENIENLANDLKEYSKG